MAQDKPMNEEFAVSGVESAMHDALGEDPNVTVKNDMDRVDEVCKKNEEHLESGAMSAAEAGGPRGSLVFSISWTDGRMGALAYHHPGKKAHKMCGTSYIDSDLGVGALGHRQNTLRKLVPQTRRVVILKDIGVQARKVYLPKRLRGEVGQAIGSYLAFSNAEARCVTRDIGTPNMLFDRR